MRVLYFARAREISGTKSEELSDPQGGTVAEVLAGLSQRFGNEFAELLARSTVVVDDVIVRGEQRATTPMGEELAILPPVSGGDGPLEHTPTSADPGHQHGPEQSHHQGRPGPLRVALLTVSDRASDGRYEDRTGPALAELVRAALGAEVVASDIVPDAFDRIAGAVRQWCDEGVSGAPVDLVLTNGGTGLSPRDLTPEAVRSVLDVEAPGLAEVMRTHGLAKTPLAALSRQLAGRRNSTIVVCVPGSVKAASESLEAIVGLLPHACAVASEPATAGGC